MTTSVFFSRFDRHAHGEGLKAHATHYCPGCGHGLVQKYLAEAIDELGVQDRTVAVSPVGCAVFMYYYLDVGNTQAAHGRAPAVAIGHKVSNPDAVVVSYQGDGDLASIGLAEILQAAQMGLPITCIFVNNAIYGMTGGQMAPTTLPGQETTTTPAGRDRFTGQPLRMAEILAQLEGPVYIERVALYDAKRRTRARRAIHKAVRLQVENRGFAFVEVLSECPVHLHMTPQEAEEWVQREMEPVYPLGVKREVEDASWLELEPPIFDPRLIADTLGGTAEAPPRFATGFPTALDESDVSVKYAGAGGDGAQTIALLTARTAINEGFDATHIPSYGPESRGGTSYADVHVATEEVLSPAAPHPHVLLAFNAPSLEKFGPMVRPGGKVLYDSSVISQPVELGDDVEMVGLPWTGMAQELGKLKVKNTVALGTLQAVTGMFPVASFLTALGQTLHQDCTMLALNEQAFLAGVTAAQKRGN